MFLDDLVLVFVVWDIDDLCFDLCDFVWVVRGVVVRLVVSNVERMSFVVVM